MKVLDFSKIVFKHGISITAWGLSFSPYHSLNVLCEFVNAESVVFTVMFPFLSKSAKRISAKRIALNQYFDRFHVTFFSNSVFGFTPPVLIRKRPAPIVFFPYNGSYSLKTFNYFDFKGCALLLKKKTRMASFYTNGFAFSR